MACFLSQHRCPLPLLLAFFSRDANSSARITVYSLLSPLQTGSLAPSVRPPCLARSTSCSVRPRAARRGSTRPEGCRRNQYPTWATAGYSVGGRLAPGCYGGKSRSGVRLSERPTVIILTGRPWGPRAPSEKRRERRESESGEPHYPLRSSRPLPRPARPPPPAPAPARLPTTHSPAQAACALRQTSARPHSLGACCLLRWAPTCVPSTAAWADPPLPTTPVPTATRLACMSNSCHRATTCLPRAWPE